MSTANTADGAPEPIIEARQLEKHYPQADGSRIQVIAPIDLDPAAVGLRIMLLQLTSLNDWFGRAVRGVCSAHGRVYYRSTAGWAHRTLEGATVRLAPPLLSREREMTSPSQGPKRSDARAALRGWFSALGVSLGTAILVITPFFWRGNASGHDIAFHASSWLDVAGQWREGDRKSTRLNSSHM